MTRLTRKPRFYTRRLAIQTATWGRVWAGGGGVVVLGGADPSRLSRSARHHIAPPGTSSRVRPPRRTPRRWMRIATATALQELVVNEMQTRIKREGRTSQPFAHWCTLRQYRRCRTAFRVQLALRAMRAKQPSHVQLQVNCTSRLAIEQSSDSHFTFCAPSACRKLAVSFKNTI